MMLILSYVLNTNPLDITLCCGSNKSIEVFDMNVGRSIRVVMNAHSRPVHAICQNQVGTKCNCSLFQDLVMWCGTLGAKIDPDDKINVIIQKRISTLVFLPS
jgi:hypothetical protein